MRLTRYKLALLAYVLFDLLIGGHCGGLLPLSEMAAAQSGPPAIGTIAAASSSCLSTNCISLQLDNNTGAATIDLSGTFAATLQFEAFSGITWTSINCTPPNSTTAVTSATAVGAWQCNVAGFTGLRVRASAYVSGTVSVVINSAHASAKSGGGSVFASGGTTNNVIPKSNGSSQLADSSITDNGTTVISTESFRAPVGLVGTVAFQLNAANVGIYSATGASVDISNGGTNIARFASGSGGTAIFSSGISLGANPGSPDVTLLRRAAANLQLGIADLNGSPVAQTLSVQNAITGTDLPGKQFSLAGSLGTGAALPLPIVLQGADASVATGTTAQTEINRLVNADTKNLTTGAATTLLSIPLATLQTTGGLVFIHMEATDGTNQCTLDDLVTYAAENSAGVFVTSTSKMGTGANACTAAKTLTATYAVTSANPALLQVTPTLTGITASRFTAVYTVMHGGMTNPTL